MPREPAFPTPQLALLLPGARTMGAVGDLDVDPDGDGRGDQVVKFSPATDIS